jgi:16S rRNA (cytidine1402-2'-O)-methyltransferase
MSNLYVVATPIGNLEDITLRALRVLKEVDLILCEDTRVTRKLLDHYGIKTPTESYHERSKITKIKKIIALLAEGKNLALVSDAGTPGISDPGSFLIARIRESLGEDAKIIPVPGPSALAAILSSAGLPAAEFAFIGFLPHKKGRETLFKEMAESRRATVFYESPHRIMKTLESLKSHLDEERKIVLGREMTKVFEEIIEGSAGYLLNYYKENPDKIRGEFALVISGK